jgi:8-oxo-dGTP pyrophosphatase MutT (NUDIX family)
MSSEEDAPAEPRVRERGDGTLREVSYGGLVVRGDLADGSAELIAVVPRGKRALALPKGGAFSQDETGVQVALREVREETGLEASVRESLGSVDYWYRRGGRRVFKSVHFYLCDYVAGDIGDHDDEVDEVRWVPLEQAEAALSYRGEREIARRALARLRGAL